MDVNAHSVTSSVETGCRNLHVLWCTNPGEPHRLRYIRNGNGHGYEFKNIREIIKRIIGKDLKGKNISLRH